ncbi:MAG: hypothetical protein GC191_06165 [Azospirillum sp.]|nr:hypothetical protein [Azospirillum sp.]
MATTQTEPRSRPLEGWHRAAFRAGEIAAIGGMSEEINPHRSGSLEAVNWLAGWRAHPPRSDHRG